MKGPDPGEVRSVARIGRNFSFRFGANVLSALINVAGMVLLANHLTASVYGDYAYYHALIPLVSSLADLGIGVITTREIARHRDEGARYLGDALLVKGMLAATLLAITLPAVLLTAHGAPALLLSLIAVTALMDFSQDPSVWVLRAHERLDLEALLLLVSQVLWLGALAVAAALKAPLSVFIGAATAAYVVRLTVGAFIVGRVLYRPRFVLERSRLIAILRNGLPVSLAMFCVVLYGRVGVLMLKALARPVDVAYFNIAYMLSQPLGFVSSALSVAAFPALSRRAQLGPGAVGRPLLLTSKYQLLIALPLMTGLCLLADRFVPLLFPRGDYGAAASALQVTSLALLFVFFNLMSRYVLTALDRQDRYLQAIAVGFVVNLALCVLLIPRYRFMGAGWAWVAAEFSIFLVCQHALSPFVAVRRLLEQGQRPLLASLLLGIAVFWLRPLPLAPLVALGSLVYVTMLFMLRVFSADEIQLARAVYVSLRLPGWGHLQRVGGR